MLDASKARDRSSLGFPTLSDAFAWNDTDPSDLPSIHDANQDPSAITKKMS